MTNRVGMAHGKETIVKSENKNIYISPSIEWSQVATELGIAGSVVTEGGSTSIYDYNSWSDFGD